MLDRILWARQTPEMPDRLAQVVPQHRGVAQGGGGNIGAGGASSAGVGFGGGGGGLRDQLARRAQREERNGLPLGLNS